jgi:hypothetical protein
VIRRIGSSEPAGYDFNADVIGNQSDVQQEMLELAAVLETNEAATLGPDARSNAIGMLMRLPLSLRKALARELRTGNCIVSISDGWPQGQSVVVAMVNRLKAKSAKGLPNVALIEVNDPHYWRNEIAQKDGDSHYLLIA